MRTTNIIYTILIFASLLFFMACANSNSDSSQPKEPVNKGQAIFEQYCYPCHGKDGKLGLNKASDLSVSIMQQNEIVQIVTNGRKMMSPYKNILSVQEIEAVSKYVLELRQ